MIFMGVISHSWLALGCGKDLTIHCTLPGLPFAWGLVPLVLAGPPNLIPMSGDHTPTAGEADGLGAFVGIGAVIPAGEMWVSDKTDRASSCGACRGDAAPASCRSNVDMALVVSSLSIRAASILRWLTCVLHPSRNRDT